MSFAYEMKKKEMWTATIRQNGERGTNRRPSRLPLKSDGVV